MLRNQEDHKGDKNGKVDIGGDNLGIEVVGFDDMDDGNHRDTSGYNEEAIIPCRSITVADNKDRDS